MTLAHAWVSAHAVCYVVCFTFQLLSCAGLGNQKRKRPKLAALGIEPVRTPEKNTRFLWRADVAACSDGSLGAADQVHIHLAGNGFLYRCDNKQREPVVSDYGQHCAGTHCG